MFFFKGFRRWVKLLILNFSKLLFATVTLSRAIKEFFVFFIHLHIWKYSFNQQFSRLSNPKVQVHHFFCFYPYCKCKNLIGELQAAGFIRCRSFSRIAIWCSMAKFQTSLRRGTTFTSTLLVDWYHLPVFTRKCFISFSSCTVSQNSCSAQSNLTWYFRFKALLIKEDSF